MDRDSHCSDETICAWTQFRDIYVLRMEYPGVSSEFCTRYMPPRYRLFSTAGYSYVGISTPMIS